MCSVLSTHVCPSVCLSVCLSVPSVSVCLSVCQVIEEEGLAENAARLGRVLRKELEKLDRSIVSAVRGRGLLNAIVITQHDGMLGWAVSCL